MIETETNGRIALPSPILLFEYNEHEFSVDAIEFTTKARDIADASPNDNMSYFVKLRDWVKDRYEVDLPIGVVSMLSHTCFEHEDEMKKKLQILRGCQPPTDSTQPNSTE